MNKQEIKSAFEDLLKPQNDKETYTLKGQVLAMKFLGEIDEEMERQNMKKKDLAGKIGKSASYITQLFRGDKKPNWDILAKMADALGLEFYVTTKEKYNLQRRSVQADSEGEWFFMNYDSVPKADYNIRIPTDQFALAV